MARKSAANRSSVAESTPRRPEIPALLAFLVGVGLLASVLVFGTPKAALMGPAGALLGQVAWAALGWLCVPVAVIWVGVFASVLIGGPTPHPARSAVGGGLVLVGTALWLDLVVCTGPSDLAAGGALGTSLSGALVPVLGILGSALCATACVLSGALVAVDGSVRTAWRHAVRAAALGSRFLVGQVSAWLEAHRAARARRAELRQAEQARAEGERAHFREQLGRMDSHLQATKERRVQALVAREEERSSHHRAVDAPDGDDSGDAPVDSERPSRASSPPAVEAPPSVDLGEPAVLETESEPEVDGPDLDAAEVIERIDGGLVGITEPVILERKATEATFDEERAAYDEEPKSYELPPLQLLDYEGDAPDPIDQSALKSRATRLEEKLRTYGVEGRVAAIRPGPVVTTYEYQPAPGVKVSKIANLADDIAMSMEAVRVRIVAPIPGRGVVGIELPNDTRETVYLKELVAHERFRKGKSLLTLALGKDAEGDVQVRDLKKMPHLLVAGTTGSGKSVSINTMILSILYKATPEQVKFIMVDPKMLELSLYNDIPHLLLPVVTDARKASIALQWTVDEMERRYQLLSDMKVRDIDGFNKKLDKLQHQRSLGTAEGDPLAGKELPESLPYIVVLIDEFADLMCVAPRDVEASVQRLAQKARAAGIHVLLATQRPSTDVITGVIKNNFPSRISFQVASRHDSATVLNTPGAENLLGMGDSLFVGVSSRVPERIHGGFVSESEVERVVEFWKGQAKPKYDESILKRPEEDEPGAGRSSEADEHYDMAVQIVTDTRRASISALQRRLRVGYNRAARMIEMMEEQGIVGPASGPKGEREVLVQSLAD